MEKWEALRQSSVAWLFQAFIGQLCAHLVTPCCILEPGDERVSRPTYLLRCDATLAAADMAPLARTLKHSSSVGSVILGGPCLSPLCWWVSVTSSTWNRRKGKTREKRRDEFVGTQSNGSYVGLVERKRQPGGLVDDASGRHGCCCRPTVRDGQYKRLTTAGLPEDDGGQHHPRLRWFHGRRVFIRFVQPTAVDVWEQHDGHNGGGRLRPPLLLPGDGADRHRGRFSQLPYRGRQLHGHDLVQDRQTAADHLQLLSVQSGSRRLCHRTHLYAFVHRLHTSRAVAAGTLRLRHLALVGLPRFQRLGPQSTHHQLRQVRDQKKKKKRTRPRERIRPNHPHTQTHPSSCSDLRLTRYSKYSTQCITSLCRDQSRILPSLSHRSPNPNWWAGGLCPYFANDRASNQSISLSV